MHELGHSLGLVQYDGIDSEKYTMNEYPSVMNYNAPARYFGYGDGDASGNDHDDWGRIENRMAGRVFTQAVNTTASGG